MEPYGSTRPGKVPNALPRLLPTSYDAIFAKPFDLGSQAIYIYLIAAIDNWLV
jgi:hypothetical protein